MVTANVPQRAKQHTIYRTADGTRVGGVTTILRVLGSETLMIWANRIGLEGIKMNEYRDELASIGTLAHYLIQCELQGKSPDVSEYTPQQQSQAAECLKSWHAWKRVHSIELIDAERPMVSETHRYGGTIDLYAMLDGVKTLLDYKSGKAIYSEMLHQVAAYWHLLNENLVLQGLDPCQQAMVLRVGRDPGEGFETREVDRCEERWQLFLACKEIYNLQKVLK